MKPLLLASLLLITQIGAAFATDSLRTDPEAPSPVWVASPNASFAVRTVHSLDGHLMVGINNLGQRDLTLTVWSADNRELVFLNLNRQPGHVISLDLHEYADGLYRIEIANDAEKVVKDVKIATSARLARQTFVTVAGTMTRM
ncbi:hypothetical protein [Spirosoma montaniterrae]|uniref:Secretion system C-terminal sorting domain-containing protein n=1 Tax=Spirosoma montaniterrae TaxID=1178516 RepID=A0A1P9WY44_9BACT|nr:hypothetical protein [Spirosoma montaniterrae]AQG80273.1 hypothetical protein AWR27_13670 [Spirosoma montaniterrae]